MVSRRGARALAFRRFALRAAVRRAFVLLLPPRSCGRRKTPGFGVEQRVGRHGVGVGQAAPKPEKGQAVEAGGHDSRMPWSNPAVLLWGASAFNERYKTDSVCEAAEACG